MNFAKVQSVGNDFVLIEHEDGLDYPAIAQELCRRHFGIGSDGLLVLHASTRDGMEATEAAPLQLALRMFNPDGTEDFCGNGLRCAALYARAKEYVNSDRFEISQLGRTIPVKFEGEDILTKLAPGSYEPSEVPTTANEELVEHPIEVGGGQYIGHALSTGSTHFVLPVKELPADEEFFAISPALEHHKLFPERTSVMWTQKVDTGHIRLRIWERGVGETLGCGTGSTAAAVVYARRSGFQGEVHVENPGGSLYVTLRQWDDSPVIRGRAQIVFDGFTF